MMALSPGSAETQLGIERIAIQNQPFDTNLQSNV
jgi:hypothetical protein